MSVIDIFTEDIDFPNGSICGVNTTNGRYRNSFSRCAIGPSASNSGPIRSTTFTPVTSCWLSARLFFDGTFSNEFVPNAIGFESLAASGTGIYMGMSGTGAVSIHKGNAGATTLATSAAGYIVQGVFRLDMQIISYGVNGTVNIYINGALAVSYSGDITNAGMASINCISIGNNNNWGEQTWASEIIVADESTLGFQGVDLHEITANGTTQQWNNPDIANFDEITINDANSTYTNTAGQDEQAALANSVSGNFAIKAVKIVARASAPAGSAVTNLKLGFNNAGTIGVGTAHTITDAFAPYADVLTIDPTTGQPFTSIDGYQLDLRSA